MKRVLLLTALVCLSLTLPPSLGGAVAAHASGPAVHHVYGTSPAWLPRASQRLAPMIAAHQTSTSGSIQSGSQLRLPASAFPSTSYLYEEHEESTTRADNSLFGSLHVGTYAALGMQGGWFQYYTTRLPDGLFDVAYLGSYYASSSDAARAFDDVRNNPKFARGTMCNYGEQCYQDYIGVTFSDGEYRGLLQVVQSSNGLAEVISVAPAADLDTLQGQMIANVNRVSGAFVQAAAPAVPTATSTPTQVPPTAIPANTATPLPTATSTPTSTATATPTNTPIPLFASVRLAHASVAVGKKQTISVTSLAGAHLSVVVTFPDGVKKRASGVGDTTGNYSWSFKQPAGHTTASKHTVHVLVTATHGSDAPVQAKGSYTIR